MKSDEKSTVSRGLLRFEVSSAELFSKKLKEFKEHLLNRFLANCSAGLYIPKFPLLDDKMEDIEKFGSLEMMHSSGFERLNVHIKDVYLQISQRRCTCMGRTGNIMNQEIWSAILAVRV